MKKFDFLKALSVLLVLSMLVCSLIACEEYDDTSNTPSTPEGMLEALEEAMTDEPFKLTTTTTRTVIGNSSFSTTLNSNDVTEMIVDGSNYKMIIEENGFSSIQTYVDGVLYMYISMPDGKGGTLEFKNKLTVSEEDLAALGEAAEEFESLSAKFMPTQYAVLNEEGRTIITGTGIGEEGKKAFDEMFGSINDAFASMGLPISMSFLYDETTISTAIELPTFRCVNQRVDTKCAMVIATETITMDLSITQEFSYEGDLSVTAPADADSYKECSSFDDIFGS